MKYITLVLALVIAITLSGCGSEQTEQVTFITKTQAVEQDYYPTDDMVKYDFSYEYRNAVNKIKESKELKGLDFYQRANMLIGFDGEEAKAVFSIVDTTVGPTENGNIRGMLQVYFYIVGNEPQYGVYTWLPDDENNKSLYMIKNNKSTSDGKKYYELNSEEDNKINIYTIVYKEPKSFVDNYLLDSQVISNVE